MSNNATSSYGRFKPYLMGVSFTLAIVVLYRLVDINLFTLDFPKVARQSLFTQLRTTPIIDRDIVVLNTGRMTSEEIRMGIDAVIKMGPSKIGVNLCHLERGVKLQSNYSSNDHVIFADCDLRATVDALCELISDGNIVTHFKSDTNDYFELKLMDFHGRGNMTEVINFSGAGDFFYSWDLKSVNELPSEFLREKIVLVGYVGDYLTDKIYNFTNCRITPMNKFFGQDGITPDMHDTYISANVIFTIKNKLFINEIDPFSRVVILLIFSVLNVTAITYTRTRMMLVNLMIGLVTFILLTALGPMLIVLLFDNGYLLNLDELSIMLMIITTSTVVLGIKKNDINFETKFKRTGK